MGRDAYAGDESSDNPWRLFISYRRDDAADSAGRMYDSLRAHFREDQLFMDVDTILPGQNFVRVLVDAVRQCKVLLAVIGRTWLSAQDHAGRRRLELAEDFVRLEIEAALRRKILVIPVLVQGAVMPSASELPDSLKPLAHIQAVELNHRSWRTDMQRLVERLKKHEGEIRQLEAVRTAKRREAEAARRRGQDDERLRPEAVEAAEAARRRGQDDERRRRDAQAAAGPRVEAARTNRRWLMVVTTLGVVALISDWLRRVSVSDTDEADVVQNIGYATTLALALLFAVRRRERQCGGFLVGVAAWLVGWPLLGLSYGTGQPVEWSVLVAGLLLGAAGVGWLRQARDDGSLPAPRRLLVGIGLTLVVLIALGQVLWGMSVYGVPRVPDLLFLAISLGLALLIVIRLPTQVGAIWGVVGFSLILAIDAATTALVETDIQFTIVPAVTGGALAVFGAIPTLASPRGDLAVDESLRTPLDKATHTDRGRTFVESGPRKLKERRTRDSGAQTPTTDEKVTNRRWLSRRRILTGLTVGAAVTVGVAVLLYASDPCRLVSRAEMESFVGFRAESDPQGDFGGDCAYRFASNLNIYVDVYDFPVVRPSAGGVQSIHELEADYAFYESRNDAGYGMLYAVVGERTLVVTVWGLSTDDKREGLALRIAELALGRL